MGLFGSTSPFDQYVEKATSEKNTGEDWGQLMDICDRVKESGSGSKDCLKSITKRLSHDNPRVVLYTITLLDACINNCGRKFLLEVASRDFEIELYKQITSSKTHPKVADRLRESLKKWVESEFKSDRELGLIPALYNKLLKEGYVFDAEAEGIKKTEEVYSNDPNVVNNKQEEDDIAKAIQLSLQISEFNKTQTHSTPSLYGPASAVLSTHDNPNEQQPEKEPLKVRAVYDFEAAEDNELTFKAGEIILVVDHSDPNWWKGTNHRGEGLFPANFVTNSLEDEQPKNEVSSKRVSFSESVEVTEVSEDTVLEPHEIATGEIDESKIDHLLNLLHEADPTGEREDQSSLSMLEEQTNAMAPNIDAELERIDRKHAQLARISNDLVGALDLYHQLMREMPTPSMPYYSTMNKAIPPNVAHPNMMPNHYVPSNPQPSTTIYGAYPQNYGGDTVPSYISAEPSSQPASGSGNHPTYQVQQDPMRKDSEEVSPNMQQPLF